jgi:hypothetical protein
MNAFAVSDTAEIKSIDYEIRQDLLILGVRIDYNFTANNKLKVIVDSYSPRKIVSQIIDVKSGLGTRTVHMEIDYISLNENWRATLSLRLTNENGENLDLLHMKNVDVNLREVLEQAKLARGPYPAIALLLAIFLIGLGIILRRRRKRAGRERSKRRSRPKTP